MENVLCPFFCSNPLYYLYKEQDLHHHRPPPPFFFLLISAAVLPSLFDSA